MSQYIRESLGEFWAGTISKLGIILLVVVLVVSMYTLITLPLDYGTRIWNNPKLWVDNPKSVSPAWINLFADPKLLEHQTPFATNPVMEYPTLEGDYYKFYNLTYRLSVDQFPTFFTLKLENVKYYQTPPSVRLKVVRPDSRSVDLLTFKIEPPLPNEQEPFIRYVKEPGRFLVSGDPNVANTLSEYISREYDVTLPPSAITEIGYEEIVFGEMVGDSTFVPLKGEYIFSVVLTSKSSQDEIGKTTAIVAGQLYGNMGTDSLGRDLSQGLLFGFPVALLIGFVTSVVTTIIGSSLGIVGGYVGGKTDDLIQRFSDIVNNIPQLPLLIFMTFVFGGRLWVIVVVLIAFGWPNLVIVVRSMILQMKSSSFVEAAKSLGSSKWRIMGRHIFPQVAPYILSQMIFYTPSAILAEAALSFLGLGDPTLPTWGQILEYGFNNGAVFLGYWWWILPPGLLIVFSAITFVFIALGLEPVVNPRLRRWR